MLEFGAEKFLEIGGKFARLKEASQAAEDAAEQLGESHGEEGRQAAAEGARRAVARVFEEIAGNFAEIGCHLTAKSALRMSSDRFLTMSADACEERALELEALAKDEMEQHLFFWVPYHRAEYYFKTTELVGSDGVSRFGSVMRELQEACRCYAFGRYTASAFHLMRMTEAALRALAVAIGFPVTGNNWGQVFPEFERQFALSPKLRPKPWDTHGEFLELLGGDLRAVNKAWRNRIAHLDAYYGEEDAKLLLAVIPAFMRHAASRMDEKGNLT